MPKKIVLFLFGFGFISALELYIRTFHRNDLFYESGLYFQGWTSDAMMQVLPIQQLHDAPLKNLFYLHIQPPMLDIIRASLAALFPLGGNHQLAAFVDAYLYVIWGMLYAVLAVLVFVWIRSATGSSKIAMVAYVFWVVHPGAIAMATLLDSTMLSAVLTTWMLYELWRFSRQEGSELRLVLAAILFFLTRTVFQWYFIPILLLTLWISGASRKSIFKVIAPISVVVAVFLLKQFVLFGTLSTTTFTGEHKLGLIQYHPTAEEIDRHTASLSYKYPDSARIHSSKYNNEHQIITNIVYGRIFSERLTCCFLESLKGIGKSIDRNIRVFWRPTSQYSDFKYLDRLFWRGLYDFMFSKAFALSLTLAMACWFFLNRHRVHFTCPDFSLLMVAGYIFMIIMIGNRYEWVESDRLKFLLEPSFYVFIVTQFVLALRWARAYLMANKQKIERVA